ncbi:hypothetical protein BRARA_C00811 [Brassica rapa]|uniref:NOT2/NOT3/NOT5 C-terminal domain-containing protein n=1 Tax=Brassica campestris TaxID=3711 RepID=A0A398A0K0_BRACM|nr:hypothetical protein BRARA_C00811 [Brassica rapa]
MGASRKLQGEIDRVLKKVQEGVDVFDSIWNKVYDTDNVNQKEKFEAELKKEIKKLQRYRDQIKTWIQTKLVDNGSKAIDPKEKAKSETRDWLNNVVSELESQIDSFEAELEGLSVKKGKSRPPRLTHLETSITRHKDHIINNVQPLTSPLSKMVLPPAVKGNDGTVSDSNPSDVAASIGRAYSPSIVSGSQWRPGSPFQSQNETVRGRTEIVPDQRENYLQLYQQLQQGHGNLLGMASLSGGNEKQNDDQLQQNLPDDSTSMAASKTIPNEDDSKGLFDNPSGMPSYMLDQVQVTRDGPDFSPGQPIQPGQPSSSHGVIGRRSNSELGTIGEPSALGPMNDQMHNLQMLEAAFYRLPQPKDSERPRPYTPRNPAITPQSFPQTQAPIVSNPLFWERLGSDAFGTEPLFFAFYYQQNSYQQYLAAKELKKQSWRYHRKFNTWFQRHKEPTIATDEYEQGAYVYFDFQTPKDENRDGGWVQRIKNEFTFEYSYLEDELAV